MDGVTASSPKAIPERRSSTRFTTNRSPSKQPFHLLSEHEWLSYSKAETVGDSPNGLAIVSVPTSHGESSKQPRRSKNEQQRPRSMRTKLIYQESKSWSPAKDNLIMGPFDYLHGHPGKDVRSQLISAFNMWLHVPKQSLDIITGVVGMLHTASLLVDDVEDNSLLRRGVPVAHSIFGTAQTINSANYVYFRALQELQKLQSPEAIQIYTTELLNLHRGQGMDLYWRDTLTCPTEDDYLEMVDNKTGGLFRLAIKLMQAESASSKNCIPLANAIGMLFQIVDDYKNLSSVVYTQNKGLAEDLTEGKFSFPIIHSIRSDPSNLVLINILKQKTLDEDVKRYAMKYMESTGSFAYTRGVLKELTAKSLAIVADLESGDDGEDGGGSSSSSESKHAGAAVRKIIEKLSVDEE